MTYSILLHFRRRIARKQPWMVCYYFIFCVRLVVLIREFHMSGVGFISVDSQPSMEETILVGDDLMMGPPSPIVPPEIASHVLQGVDLCDGILRNLFLCKSFLSYPLVFSLLLCFFGNNHLVRHLDMFSRWHPRGSLS